MLRRCFNNVPRTHTGSQKRPVAPPCAQSWLLIITKFQPDRCYSQVGRKRRCDPRAPISLTGARDFVSIANTIDGPPWLRSTMVFGLHQCTTPLASLAPVVRPGCRDLVSAGVPPMPSIHYSALHLFSVRINTTHHSLRCHALAVCGI